MRSSHGRPLDNSLRWHQAHRSDRRDLLQHRPREHWAPTPWRPGILRPTRQLPMNSAVLSCVSFQWMVVVSFDFNRFPTAGTRSNLTTPLRLGNLKDVSVQVITQPVVRSVVLRPHLDAEMPATQREDRKTEKKLAPCKITWEEPENAVTASKHHTPSPMRRRCSPAPRVCAPSDVAGRRRDYLPPLFCSSAKSSSTALSMDSPRTFLKRMTPLWSRT